MANYSLVLDTKFKPFSYQEMLAPVMAATQAHQVLETEYGDLATKASVWERMANEQSDPYAYKMYKTYSEDLESMAEQLARSGLNPASRRNMLNMKSRYSSEILPIETAYKRREELAAEQRKAIAANPTLRYQRMAGQMSLDDFIRNPSLDYGESYSGALLTQQVSQAAANLQRALTNKGQLQKLGLPYQYERMLQYGATPSQVLAAMAEQAQNEPETATFLRGIVDQVMQSSGVADWADPATLREFRAFANQGLYSAIGQAKLDNFTDQFSMQDALHARQHARQVAAQAANNSQQHYRLNPMAIRGQAELSAANQEINKYRKYFYTDPKTGHYRLTAEGRREYFNTRTSSVGASVPGSAAKTQTFTHPSDFRKFMDRIGAGKYIGEGKNWQPGNAGLAFQRHVRNNQEDSYDTYHTTEYSRSLDTSYGSKYFDDWKAMYEGADTFQTVKWDSKNRKWVEDKSISVNDLKGYTASQVRYSRYGDTLMLTGDDKPTLRVKLPAGMSISEQNNTRNAIIQADIYNAIIQSGRQPKVDYRGAVQLDKNGNPILTNQPLTDADRMFFENKAMEYYDVMNAYGSQYVVPSKTETETFGVLPQ